ncbi:MAG: hypothetical protein AAB686_03590 [Patescibacteria group bacterium]
MKFVVSTAALFILIGLVLFSLFVDALSSQTASPERAEPAAAPTTPYSGPRLNPPFSPVPNRELPAGFRGPTGLPYVIGPSGPPPQN